jgi:hypothetical protein
MKLTGEHMNATAKVNAIIEVILRMINPQIVARKRLFGKICKKKSRKAIFMKPIRLK